jgi:pyruvate,orthophosphate dikinase
MTSHAALVARGWGKCCIVGCGDLDIDYKARTVKVGDKVLNEGDWISLNGTQGTVYAGKLSVVDADPDRNPWYKKLMAIADRIRRLGVHTNADRPIDAAVAVRFGAEGIGLCRTEHMFFEGPRIISMRKMILADDEEGRRKALEELLPLQRQDFIDILKALEGLPATIRLLDPPLHEFVPHDEAGQKAIAEAMGISPQKVKERVDSLFEFNPMLGHRGCRLGITYPEITAMQARAIIEAAYAVVGSKVEIMVPLVGHVKELIHQKKIIMEVFEKVKAEKKGQKPPELKVGTMIEVPRGALTADEIAKEVQFFSFGTNDLTQMGCGFSRDDAGKFLEEYVGLGIYDQDPFQVLDQTGVGELVRIAVEKGRKARPDIKLGICGEHGGDPSSIHFFHQVGLDYVSCSPFRVPVARLAAAQAALSEGKDERALDILSLC